MSILILPCVAMTASIIPVPVVILPCPITCSICTGGFYHVSSPVPSALVPSTMSHHLLNLHWLLLPCPISCFVCTGCFHHVPGHLFHLHWCFLPCPISCFVCTGCFYQAQVICSICAVVFYHIPGRLLHQDSHWTMPNNEFLSNFYSVRCEGFCAATW